MDIDEKAEQFRLNLLSEIQRIFNNRELSMIFWVIIFSVWFLMQKSVRQSTKGLIKSFFQKSILSIIFLMAVYVAIIVFTLFNLKIWDMFLLKDTIYWTLGVAFILLVNVHKATGEDKHFKKVIIGSFKLIIIIEFLSNLYVFNMILELLFLPIILFFSIMSALAESKNKYEPVKKLSDSLLAIYGIAVFIFSVYHITTNFNNIVTLNNLRTFLLSPILTILYLPFLYFMALFMAYESFLKSRRWILKENKEAFRYLKWEIIFRCNFSLRKIRKVSRKLHVYSSIGKTEIRNDLKILLR